jgi:ubiquitin C-terminal hydrolase
MKAEDSLLCHHCDTDTQHYKTAQIVYTPKVLVLHLQRYNEAIGEKNNQFVTFPDILRLGNVMQLEGEYDLHAVIHHQGTLTYGHYWTDVRVDGQWQRFNDLNTSIVSWSEVVKETAYVLFYTKK